MANDKKMVQEITSMEVDFAQWYTDICKKADLVDYSSVKGCMIIRPYGYAIWENIQRILDTRFKELGHENIYMPLFIPESLLTKEKEHVEGFAPEVAWVTHGGSEKLTERLCVRPTSETLFCEHYANVVKSYRDLPKLYNQWCNVVRWEKTTRPFLRSREFLWQEGHTMHATAEEAVEETVQMLNVYADFHENDLAIPVVKGKKTPSDKFAGAEDTYAIEALMHDGKSLQAATSHYFGDGFAKAFGITYTNKDNKIAVPYQTSWGCTTRMIGGIIMTHGDDNGLCLPPAVAPIQVIIVPIQQQKEGVTEKVNEVLALLKAAGIRAKADLSNQSPGWKFAEYEMKGVPLRIEIGPRDLAENKCVTVMRHNYEKSFESLDGIAETVKAKLEAVRSGMYERAQENRSRRTYSCTTMDEIKASLENGDGFVKAMWCGSEECEDTVKAETGVGSRCIPLVQEKISDTCVCCGKPASAMVVFAKAY